MELEGTYDQVGMKVSQSPTWTTVVSVVSSRSTRQDRRSHLSLTLHIPEFSFERIDVRDSLERSEFLHDSIQCRFESLESFVGFSDLYGRRSISEWLLEEGRRWDSPTTRGSLLFGMGREASSSSGGGGGTTADPFPRSTVAGTGTVASTVGSLAASSTVVTVERGEV